MVGYVKKSTADTYRMYNPRTKKVCQTRDVTWIDWKRQDPQRDGSIFNQIPETIEDKPGVDKIELTVLNESKANVSPDDDDEFISEAGKKEDSTSNFDSPNVTGPDPFH